MRAPIAIAIALMLSTMVAGCKYDFSNPVDPSASNYQGISTVASASELVAGKAWAAPSDGSSVPVFTCSRVIGAKAYALQVAASSDFSGTRLFDKADFTSNEAPVPELLDSLSGGSTYYWRMRAQTSDWGAWCATQSFILKKATGVSIGTNFRMSSGSSETISAAIAPPDASCAMVTWASSDSSAVSVDSKGRISYITPGAVAVITATSVDGGFTASGAASVPLTSNMTTLAGSDGEVGFTDGAGTAATFGDISGICGVGGKIYITENSYDDHSGNTVLVNDVRSIDLSTHQVTRVAGIPGQSGSTDGDGTTATFKTPRGICTDGTSLYLCDFGNYTIRKIDIATNVVSTLAGSAGMQGQDDGTGSNARFSYPTNICTDGLYLYIQDSLMIRRVTITTGQVVTLIPFNDYGFGSICTDGKFLYLIGSTVIYKYELATGIITKLAGTKGVNADVDGIGGAANFFSPQALVTDGANLYLTDLVSSSISRYSLKKIDIETGAVGTIFGPADRWMNSLVLVDSTLYFGLWNTVEALEMK
jgi:hypothetical protein